MREILNRWSAEHQILVMGIGRKKRIDNCQGFPVYIFRSPFYETRFTRFFYIIGYLRLILASRSILQREQPEILFSYFETASTAIVAYLLKKWSGIKVPLVHTVWTDWYEFTYAKPGVWFTEHLPHWLMNNRWLSKLALRSADTILATSEHLMMRVRSLGYKNVMFTPTGVNIHTLQPQNGQREKFKEKLVIGYLGHLSHAKGVSLLLQALLPIIDKIDAHLVLATTEGGDEAAYVENVRHSRITHQRLVDPAAFFNMCDCSILPRRSSYGTVSYPNVLLESMACGTPVITSDLPAINEIIIDGINGFLFFANNADDLREKILMLANNPGRLKKAGKLARETMVQRMDWNLQMQRMNSVLYMHDRNHTNGSFDIGDRAQTNHWLNHSARSAAIWGNDSRAHDWINDAVFQHQQSHILQYFNDKSNLAVLDVGCGNGALTKPLSSKHRVVGLDFSTSMLKLASKHQTMATTGLVEQLPFPDNTFDAIVCVEMLQCVADQKQAIAEMARVLKSGGFIIIQTLNRSSWLRQLHRLFDQEYMWMRMLDMDELSQLITSMDLNIRVRHYNFYPLRYTGSCQGFRFLAGIGATSLLLIADASPSCRHNDG